MRYCYQDSVISQVCTDTGPNGDDSAIICSQLVLLPLYQDSGFQRAIDGYSIFCVTHYLWFFQQIKHTHAKPKTEKTTTQKTIILEKQRDGNMCLGIFVPPPKGKFWSSL